MSPVVQNWSVRLPPRARRDPHLRDNQKASVPASRSGVASLACGALH